MGNITSGARILLDFIYQADAGAARPAAYDVIFANRQNRLKKPITQMTLDQVIAAGKNWSSKAWLKKNWQIETDKVSSAAGAGQFMHETLIGLKQELRLSGSEIFDGDLQDRLAMRLLDRRGYELFIAGAIDRVEFGKRLAMEWASFPVLSACRGAHRVLTRGQSYYAGDSLNRATVTPQKVEAILDKVLETVGPVPAPAAEPEPVYLDRTVAVPVAPKALDKKLTHTSGFWERLAGLGGLSSIASASFLGDWRAIIAIAVVLIVIVALGLWQHARIVAAVKEIKEEAAG